MGSPIRVDVEVSKSWRTVVDFSLLGVAYTFSIDAWRSKRFTPFVQLFHDNAKRDGEEYGRIVTDDEGVVNKDIIAKYHVTWTSLQKFKKLQDEGNYDDYFAIRKINIITQGLKALGVWGNKHIPEAYLQNSRDVRMKVLAGVIDSSGQMTHGGYTMSFVKKPILECVRTLATSLGFLCSPVVKSQRSSDNVNNGLRTYSCFRSRISGGRELGDIPVLLSSKKVCAKAQRFDLLEFELIAV